MVNLLLHNYGELWAKNNLFPCSGLTLRHRLSLIFQVKNRKALFKSEKPIDIGQALTSKFFSDSEYLNLGIYQKFTNSLRSFIFHQ